jgi:steroid 5-alpha reductase family enzyme
VSAVDLVLVTLAFLCLVFAGLYLLARRIENYGIVDIAWSYSFAALAGFYACAGSGSPMRRLVIATLAALWSVRLGTHLAGRVIGHHPEEDSRYQQLRLDWAANFASKMFGFFQLQAVSVVILGAAFLIACLNPTPSLHPL